MAAPFHVEQVRRQFPALRQTVAGHQAVFFDGPAGTQVPQRVVDAVGGYLLDHNANRGGLFATSRQSDRLLDAAHRAMADFVGAEDDDGVVFGPNMTSLAFQLSRSLARTWRSGDEILVSRSGHDANVTPWVLAAEDAGVAVRHIEVRPDDCTLDLDDFRSQLSSRTRLVAIACASNLSGTIQPFREITAAAHDAGALVFLDAVQWAPHRLIDVTAWKCDLLACSAYKFFGPHVGVLWGRRELLERLPAYKVRPATEELPGRWMTGTQNHEGIAGAMAAVEYLADLGRTMMPALSDRRQALRAALETIARHERQLCQRLIEGLQAFDGLRVWGITDSERFDQRVPTVSFTHAAQSPERIAEFLGHHGVFVWHGNFYALPLSEALGLEPEGLIRVGLVHYNTAAEVDRLLELLGELQAGR